MSTNNDDLLKRVEALEIGVKFDVNREEVRRIQMQHLEQLRAIRMALLSEGSSAPPQGSSASALYGTSKEMMEALRAENVALKLKADKQAYRIQHLVETVEVLLTNNKA